MTPACRSTEDPHGAPSLWPVRRPRLVLAIGAAVSVLSLLVALRLQPDVSLTAMLAEDAPAAVAMKRIAAGFRVMDELLLVAQLPRDARLTDNEARARLLEFARRFEEQASAAPSLRRSIHRIRFGLGPDSPERDFVKSVIVPNMLLYVDDDAFELALARLSPDSMREQIRRNEAMIAAPGPEAGSLAKRLLRDPLRLRELFTAPAGLQSQSKQESDGAFVSADGRKLLVRIAGAEPAADLAFTSEFLKEVQRVASAANEHGLELAYSGAYAIADASHHAIRSDMVRSVIGSIVLIQLLLIIVYRRPVSFLLAITPVAAAIMTAFGVFALFSNDLTPVTAVIGAVLAGLGIDYCVHLLSNYERQRSTGIEPRAAASAALRSVAPGTAAAAATTVIGFLAISQSRVAALRDFSILGGLGLTASLAASLTILPALLVVTDRRVSVARTFSQIDVALDAMMRVTSARPRICIGAAACALAAGAIVLSVRPADVLAFDSDLTAMHPQPNQPLELQGRIAQEFGAGSGSMLLHIQAKSAEALVARAHEVDSRLQEQAARDAGVAETFGLATLLPEPSRAARRVSQLLAIDPDQVQADFEAALRASLFDIDAFADHVAFLRRLVRPATPEIQDLIAYSGLADALLPAVAGEPRSRPTEAICIISTTRPAASREARRRTITAIRAALADVPDVTLTGLNVLGHDTESAIRRDLARLLLIAAAAVIVFLLVFFRSPVDLALSLLPTLFGLVCLLAAMHVVGRGFNMVNLIALPLLCGIGVDDGIFIMTIARRHRSATAEELVERLHACTHAVIVTSATTMAAFGSLMFTSMPAIRSLGWMAALGVGACLVGTLVLLVPILLIRQNRRAESESC